MDSRTGLIPFGLLVIIFAFSFVFCLDSLAVPNMTYMVLALIGFVLALGASLFLGVFARRDGEALGAWYNTYVLVVGVIFVWYLTRIGTFYKLW
ncbi:MAG: hypothetical protein WCL50_11345 [Spirochaetota bacterium]